MIRCIEGGHILNNIDATPHTDQNCTLDGKIIQFGFTFLVNRKHTFYLFGGTILVNREHAFYLFSVTLLVNK